MGKLLQLVYKPEVRAVVLDLLEIYALRKAGILSEDTTIGALFTAYYEHFA